MLEIILNNQNVTQFDNFSLQRSLDNVGDVFSFTSPFFPDSKSYRDLFRPFSYHPVTIKIFGRTVLTGTVEVITANSTPASSSVLVQGRSKTGVIVDATFQQSDFPIQFTKAGLEEIVNNVVGKFGLTSRFLDDQGPIFEEAGPESPGETIFSFIQNLARQRQLLISQTEGGALLFWKAVIEGRPVAALAEGDNGLNLSNSVFNGQARYSTYEIFGQEPGKNDNFSTINDPALSEIIRPKSAQANNTNASNIEDSAAWAATIAVANSVQVPVTIEGWTRPDGVLWDANNIITLVAPSLMIYKPFPFLITSVTLNESSRERTTTLNLTIPGAYSGKLPVSYPWED